ncbi:ZINC FINGER PROTEIN CONSTANS-LIKE 4 [Salix purpurea]|uniref:ZINC FINGER PROTEIN CONSTANS-LIKE 4 n=1 Tax=Salix purpurea TaxID=77065 RepID=A0A9Q1A2E4_SALPP|nr:ZINC FINGER PROTEIN CONSTANS-LIKE 4 [Salix purpurea]
MYGNSTFLGNNSSGVISRRPSAADQLSFVSKEWLSLSFHLSSPMISWTWKPVLLEGCFSTGDLQHGHRAESPLLSESCMIIESMNKACKYSPEEKKERIERYKSKRNQRNFNKKIKYECRKILADSRPRIRGRFAKNDEIEKNPQLQWSNVSGEEDEEDDDNWIDFIDSFSENSVP